MLIQGKTELPANTPHLRDPHLSA